VSAFMRTPAVPTTGDAARHGRAPRRPTEGGLQPARGFSPAKLTRGDHGDF
jgi:hypothetical protein